jgi:hypothetical protein
VSSDPGTPLAFNADGSVLFYEQGNVMYSLDLLEENAAPIEVANQICDLAIDEDGSGMGTACDDGLREDFTELEALGENTNVTRAIPLATETTAFDWSDPMGQVEPVRFD